MIANDISELIGNTPLLRLTGFAGHLGLGAELLAKPEFLNPTGSVKDRAALSMLRRAMATGAIDERTTIIEPTSGNTGIGLASLCAAWGLTLILCMPESMSIERRMLFAAYGAQIELTPASEGMNGSIARAKQLASEHAPTFIPNQFENPANPQAHYETTGPELWSQTDGKLDALIAGVGTGGTLSGAGRYLKEHNPAIQLIAVEPVESRVLSGASPAPHRLQGIGANFLPANAAVALYDEILPIAYAEARDMARLCATTQGLLPGISGGAALAAAARWAGRIENRAKRAAIILPDNGERYLSTDLYR